MRFATSALIFTSSFYLLGPVAAGQCEEHLYLGFDTRLKPVLMTQLPLAKDQPVVGFEMQNEYPIVAQSRTVTAFDGQQHVVLTGPAKIQSMLVDSARQLLLQTDSGVYRPGPTALLPVRADFRGAVANSGTPFTVEAGVSGSETAFAVLRPDGVRLNLANVAGRLRTFSWNSEGLAAVVGDTLVVWQQGGREFVRLARDPGLNNAKDVALVGPSRAVVAFANAVVLLSSEGRLVLAGFQARTRWHAGTLYLLDQRTGIVWTIRGLEGVGKRSTDEAYARALVRALPNYSPQSHTAFLEAARILGCDQARQIR